MLTDAPCPVLGACSLSRFVRFKFFVYLLLIVQMVGRASRAECSSMMKSGIETPPHGPLRLNTMKCGIETVCVLTQDIHVLEQEVTSTTQRRIRGRGWSAPTSMNPMEPP